MAFTDLDPDDFILDLFAGFAAPVGVESPANLFEIPSFILATRTPSGGPLFPLLARRVVYDFDVFANRTISSQSPARKAAAGLAGAVESLIYAAWRGAVPHAGLMIAKITAATDFAPIRTNEPDGTYRYTATYALLLRPATP